MRNLITVAAMMFVVVQVADAQRLTIPRAVERMKPGPYVTSRVSEVSPTPFPEMVRQCDAIVHGTLKKIRTYLSPDEMELYTDYEITPLAVIARGSLPVLNKPGPQHPIVLRQWGGETTINGVPVKMYDENFPLLPTDTPLLLFLNHDAQTDRYEIFGEITGAFELEGGRRLVHLLSPSVGPSYAHLKGADIADAIREIHGLRR
jgi:hypothetical protein